MVSPYPTPYPNPHAPPAKKPFSTVDLVLTPLLSGLLLLGCMAGFVYSMFAAMATDACGTPGRCHDGLIGAAYAVAWGGIGLALLGTVIGVWIGAAKRTTMFIWPILGLVVLVAGMVIGGFLLNAGVGG
jgi:hypothetical protein